MRAISIVSADIRTDVDPGPAPMLQWLKIADLVIDDTYQRDLKKWNWAAIRKIAASFSWSRFSPVFVAPVEGGKYAVIDGQHRSHAAALCGFEAVPCQIVQMSRAEQADAFAAVNGLVTKVTSWQILKAALAGENEWAVRLRDLAEAGGCKLMTYNGGSSKKPGEIYAVTAFRALADRHGGGVVPALRAMRALPGWKDDFRYWDTGIFTPTLSALCQRPKAVALPEFIEGFSELDIWEAIAAAKAERATRLRSGLPAISARDLLESRLVDWISRRFPERVAASPPERLSRADAMARIGKMGGV